MKITAGLGSVNDYEDFVKAGADELFAGYIPSAWLTDRGLSVPMNRREVISCGAQLGSMSEMQRLAALREKLGVPVAITLNALSYRPQDYPLLADTVEELTGLGYESFIIADIALILYLKLCGLADRIRIHASGETGEMNTFLRDELISLGVRRIIFNRKVTPAEMKALVTAGTEYEAFFMNENCRYSGGYCMSLHCDEMPPICREEFGPLRERPMSGVDGCALCSVPELDEAGIGYLKVVGRGAQRETMLESIAIARKALDLYAQDPVGYPDRIRTILPEGFCGGGCYYRRPDMALRHI